MALRSNLVVLFIHVSIVSGATIGHGRRTAAIPGVAEGAACLTAQYELLMRRMSTECGKRPTYRNTIASGLHDIGRKNWTLYPREYKVYVDRFADNLRAWGKQPDVAGVFFVDEEGAKRAREVIQELDDPAKFCVIEVPIEQTPPHRCFHTAFEKTISLMRKDPVVQKRQMHENAEFKYALYNEATTFKMGLVPHVARVNPFRSMKVGLIDAGQHFFKYADESHRQLDFRSCGDKLCLGLNNCYQYLHDQQEYMADPFHAAIDGNDVLCGAAFSGNAEAVARAGPAIEDEMSRLFRLGFSSDDQVYLITASIAKPDLFEPLDCGGWEKCTKTVTFAGSFEHKVCRPPPSNLRASKSTGRA